MTCPVTVGGACKFQAGECLSCGSVDQSPVQEDSEAIKDYLQSSIGPGLSRALKELALRKPDNPYEYLANAIQRQAPSSGSAKA
mmetsp:Transcript_10728/g.12190  ORF Transcript_10728/g.12190 Transcript_10728/m.12190 type:complete len:84 (+) Transcript_10728:18-269(+)|eukprot:CAMPEP_0205820754 /NCGR_PEP_ID=MMETSP0206-20130828/3427_1 /ASSEMBLY_ACC=CAM_ASM_000279 /TAXON_ID=36767 /ORGANISM="Euplotes focardii, Strain TN1" /LENGTH=83 /DNA_ID=CAMNT_0053115769 /DNA_START=21 /DNA_END=272 /DNA_ORIENTATION=-